MDEKRKEKYIKEIKFQKERLAYLSTIFSGSKLERFSTAAQSFKEKGVLDYGLSANELES